MFFTHSESSDEGTQADGVISGQSCLHVNKSVNLNASKKALRQIGVSGDCTTCLNLARKTQRKPRRAKKGGGGDGESSSPSIPAGEGEERQQRGENDGELNDGGGDDGIDGGGAINVGGEDGENEEELSSTAALVVDGARPSVGVTEQNGNASPTTTGGLKESTIWLCLQCGHQGCGDTTTGHVLDHYKVSFGPLLGGTGNLTVYNCIFTMYI